jgi:hypothetical protein
VGLDITSYSRLKRIGRHQEERVWCDDSTHVAAYAYTDFPASFAGLDIVGTEQHASHAFLLGGCYEITPETVTFRFRAGSYSGYNAWRSDLASQFNPEWKPELPFFELIWFADNEGTIGPAAAAKLHREFVQHAPQYQPAMDNHGCSYQDWLYAFKLAADGGLVDFH